MLMRGQRCAVACLAVLSTLPVACSSDDDDNAGAKTDDSSPPSMEEFDVPSGSHPHDVAVADNGTVWYTAQASGELGRLDPESKKIDEVALGDGSSPHGVIIGPDGAPWVTDSGLNAIVRVEPASLKVETYPLPTNGADNVNLNTAAFATDGNLWFTGQAGFYGRVDVRSGKVDVFEAPRGPGPYGIAATPDGQVYYASLAGSYLGHVDPATTQSTVLDPTTPDQGTRRVWSDSQGRLWTSQWNAGQVAVYDPATQQWNEWQLPGDNPQPYAVFVDDMDIVWLSDFGANALVSFDPKSEQFTSHQLPSNPGEVRQLHGRTGELWGAESAADKLVVLRTS